MHCRRKVIRGEITRETSYASSDQHRPIQPRLIPCEHEHSRSWPPRLEVPQKGMVNQFVVEDHDVRPAMLDSPLNSSA